MGVVAMKLAQKFNTVITNIGVHSDNAYLHELGCGPDVVALSRNY